MPDIEKILFEYTYHGYSESDDKIEVTLILTNGKRISIEETIMDADFELIWVKSFWEYHAILAENLGVPLEGHIDLGDMYYDTDTIKKYDKEVKEYNEEFGTNFDLVYDPDNNIEDEK